MVDGPESDSGTKPLPVQALWTRHCGQLPGVDHSEGRSGVCLAPSWGSGEKQVPSATLHMAGGVSEEAGILEALS